MMPLFCCGIAALVDSLIAHQPKATRVWHMPTSSKLLARPRRSSITRAALIRTGHSFVQAIIDGLRKKLCAPISAGPGICVDVLSGLSGIWETATQFRKYK
jgi:hypothetical protein